ncbi:hypothetical protein QM716_01135 [Rhodococcus sp. IEGM 1409]|uniref:hypothetical protein n=1 Tax=Rhodococcus sp. IEGM 1409 TaxID=3047082 RepID=UPI0024B775AB|nr:hypothetical protein [Rhodococcus sp. IEGM 1409]MDI9898451.1 hypothetical protein [Rhodococcus sp. IEGM 1409]
MDIDDAHLCAIGRLAIAAAKLEYIARSLDPNGAGNTGPFWQVTERNLEVINQDTFLNEAQKDFWQKWISSASKGMKRRNQILHAFWSSGNSPGVASAYDLRSKASTTYTTTQIDEITSELNQLAVNGFLFSDEVNDKSE